VSLIQLKWSCLTNPAPTYEPELEHFPKAYSRNGRRGGIKENGGGDESKYDKYIYIYIYIVRIFVNDTMYL
jgi:hypothetical protein